MAHSSAFKNDKGKPDQTGGNTYFTGTEGVYHCSNEQEYESFLNHLRSNYGPIRVSEKKGFKYYIELVENCPGVDKCNNFPCECMG